MLQAQLSGQLVAGPADSAQDNLFPAATTNEPFTLNPPATPYNVATGMMTAVVTSPNAFEALPGVGGAVGPVTQAKVLYLRVQVPMQFRITYSGDGTPKVRYVRGLSIEEVDLAHPITLVEVQGSGTVTYFAAGDQ